MTDDERTRFAALESRLESIETANGRLRKVLIVLALPILAALVLGQVQTPRDAVTAKRFVVVDDEGESRATFGMLPSGTPYPQLLIGSTVVITPGAVSVSRTLPTGDRYSAVISPSILWVSSPRGSAQIGGAAEGPFIRLVGNDSSGVRVGPTDLKNPSTGSVIRRAIGSIVLLGPGGDVMWSMPVDR